ncbi:ankyrin repeat protein, putative [Trichomonas vaginalis G3]|uniref:Ankyrin repeat protein, putative n=1 Tax=Trichomonas vaginalis (strain ATCC PRA-98 / G3) TaxID=412133 RepID=A2F0N2_TRIV3|nr:spectrin binding [Trichomonas vaginalis G3]EAY01547.1 ankyrin repeat protein, putative [Trichomonas vaginalis G3]KAI5485673.1 spectrin binding [Trichomonas vaginalis G3]|eukprot:XP_001330318.1 ankyrin repeat protein [Trichomonas vaginalis G3]
MSVDYSKPYTDFIEAFEKLFSIKPDKSVEDLYNTITNVLISKYKLSGYRISKIILTAIQYNYASTEIYIKILELLGFKNNNICKLDFPLEGSIEYILMHDQIDKFKEYISQKNINNNDTILEIPMLKIKNYSIHDEFEDLKTLSNLSIVKHRVSFAYLSLIKACAYFGSVNIFKFLFSNLYSKLDNKCLRLAIIGRNTDIINDCLKDNAMDSECLRDIVKCHNNEMLSYVLDRQIFTIQDFAVNNSIGTNIYEDIIKYQNLKAVFLLFAKEKNFIVPWCAVFPQTNELLMKEKLSLDKVTWRKLDIFHYAFKSKNVDICRYLLDSNSIDVNKKSIDEKTYLHYAVMKDCLDIADLLISHGIDINAKDYHGITPLHCAVINDKIRMVEFLIWHGADINTKDYHGKTPIHYAVGKNNIRIVKSLISHGADINSKDYDYKTPLHYSVDKVTFIEIIEFLISHGADINSEDCEGKTPFNYLIHNEFNPEKLELLLSHGANIDSKDHKGNMSFQYIAFVGFSQERLKFLLMHGANINLKDQCGKTSLHYSAMDESSPEKFKFLITNGADINA